jgi:hypothetical protein
VYDPKLELPPLPPAAPEAAAPAAPTVIVTPEKPVVSVFCTAPPLPPPEPSACCTELVAATPPPAPPPATTVTMTEPVPVVGVYVPPVVNIRRARKLPAVPPPPVGAAIHDGSAVGPPVESIWPAVPGASPVHPEAPRNSSVPRADETM